jgi:hypothetical protein
MDNAISVADPAVGTIFFHLRPDSSIDDSRSVIEAAHRRHESETATAEYQQRLLRYLFDHHYPLVVHEWAHMLQAIAYPGVYLAAVRALVLGERIWIELQEDPEDWPLRRPVPTAWWSTIQMPTQPWRFWVDDQLVVQAAVADRSDRRRNEIAETDLLEEDASIFQYKVEIGADGSGQGYRRWLSEQHRYRSCFKFLVGLLGVEEAYVALPGIVRACFRTTSPLLTFVRLVRATLVETPRTLAKRDADAYLRWAMDVTERGLGLPRAPIEFSTLADTTDAFVDDRAWATLIESGWHPLQQLARTIRAESDGDPAAPEWLLHPWQQFQRSPQRPSQEFFDTYWPPLAAVAVAHRELLTGDAILMISERKYMPDADERKAFYFAMTSILRRHIAFQIFGGHHDDLPHPCPHHQCEYHATGLCQRWPNIPSDPRDCPFPQWFSQHSGRRIDVATSTLRVVAGA